MSPATDRSNSDAVPEDAPSLSDREPEGDIHGLHAPIMREKDRPRDGFQPIPLTLLFLFFGLLMWGGWYLGAFSAGWRVDIYYPGQQVEEAAAAGGEAAEAEPQSPEELAALGKRVYTQCAACHQNNGQGLAGNFPPLDGAEWVTGSKPRLIRILLHGMEGPVVVKGQTYNAQMPSWGGQLSDEQIAGVLTYIRGAWSNDAGPIRPEEVGEVRAQTDGRTGAWTARELEALD